MVDEKKQRGWKASLLGLIRNKGKYSADGNRVISFATKQARKENLFAIFNDLRNLGYKIQDLKNIKGKHINALVNYYTSSLESGTLKAATIRNRFSHLRTFSKWIDKAGLVHPIEHYVSTPISIKRPSSAIESKTWIEKGFDPYEKIENIRKENPRIADALSLQLLFGLRSKESLLIQPHLADKQRVLIINHGAKGGRTRFIPIESEQQRELLDKIKGYVGLNESLIPPDENYENFRRQYYRILQKHGIARKAGITAHGLRHQHLNDLYEKTTGEKSPVHGGKLYLTDKTLHKHACDVVSREAGHSSRQIAKAYIGSRNSAKLENIVDNTIPQEGAASDN